MVGQVSLIVCDPHNPPAGWLYCDGSAVDQTTYANLYAFSGCYGNNNPVGAFNLPDLRGQEPLPFGAPRYGGRRGEKALLYFIAFE
jgi:microcystin-dependent protein